MVSSMKLGKLFLPVLVFIALTLIGCSRRYNDLPAYIPFNFGSEDELVVGRFKSAYLAEQIDLFYRGADPGPIGVTTFVDVNNLYSTSPFGRLYAEQLMSELSMRGFDVIELRQADALQFLNSGGEFMLSREVPRVRAARDLGGVLVGTYLVSSDRVYVNSRLLDPSTSLILSAASVEMSKTRELARLLRNSALPASLERIPVRTLGDNQFAWRDQRDRIYNLEEDTIATAPTMAQPILPPPTLSTLKSSNNPGPVVLK